MPGIGLRGLEFAARLLEPLGQYVNQHERDALAGKHLRYCAPEPSRGTGDQCHALRRFLRHSVFLC
jgi:hypothetical protein